MDAGVRLLSDTPVSRPEGLGGGGGRAGPPLGPRGRAPASRGTRATSQTVGGASAVRAAAAERPASSRSTFADLAVLGKHRRVLVEVAGLRSAAATAHAAIAVGVERVGVPSLPLPTEP
jgi:hypothetical protein